jgi:hypothetical protein
MMDPENNVPFGNYGLGGICKDAIDDILEWCDPSLWSSGEPECAVE